MPSKPTCWLRFLLGCASSLTLLATAQSAIANDRQAEAPALAAEAGLAEHLQEIGTVIYGRADCPATRLQVKIFGRDAARHLNFVNCDRQPERCTEVGIQATPTWEINGRLHPGLRSLDRLAITSRYDGDRNFRPHPSLSQP